MMVNNTAREIRFYDLNNKCKAIKEAELEKMQDDLAYNKFHTWTCKYGYPIQGILPLDSDGTDINAVCAAPKG